jgi:hypothetical protein
MATSRMKLVKKKRRGPTRPAPSPSIDDREAISDEMYVEIGRRLALAVLSYQGAITYETARKNYGSVPPGSYWINLAKRVSADYTSGRFGGWRSR